MNFEKFFRVATFTFVPVMLAVLIAANSQSQPDAVQRTVTATEPESTAASRSAGSPGPRPAVNGWTVEESEEATSPAKVALLQYVEDIPQSGLAETEFSAFINTSVEAGECNACNTGGEGEQPCSRCEWLPVPMGCNEQAPGCVKGILGVNEDVCRRLCREPTFQDSQIVPWEMFAYGEYIGPHRTPHVPEYRLRVDDRLEFVYFKSRKQSPLPYQIFVGDTISISSATDSSLNQERLVVLSDGTISLPLIGEVQAAGKTISQLQEGLNNLYLEYLNDPAVLVQVIAGNTPLNDIIDSVDATMGRGGQRQEVLVSPDGTIQLPVIGSVPAVGLTLYEIRREVNARYGMRATGLEITPILLQRAPRFFYVLGQVTTPGRYEMTAPTTALQAIALAEGDLQGGNLRNIVILRRDENWRLTATRLDLAGAIHGRRPFPSDEMFLRDSDIVIVPRKPIQRLSEAVDLYFTKTIYGIYPRAFLFNIDGIAAF